MLREFVLPPNGEKRLQVEGQYLIVTQATGPIELSIGGTLPVTVDEKDRIHLRGDSPNDRSLRIKNVSGGTNTIELHTSDLLIDKRTAIDINNSVSIAEDQLVGIDPTANIMQAIVQNAVAIAPSGNTISIEPSQFIGIDPSANVVVATVENAVGIDPAANAVNATVQNAVGIDPTANAVDATIQNAIEIAASANTVNPVHKVQTFASQPTITFAASSPPITLAANSDRDLLILTADSTNTASIWLGGVANEGVPLAPGEHITLALLSSLDVVGELDDTLYIAETLHT